MRDSIPGFTMDTTPITDTSFYQHNYNYNYNYNNPYSNNASFSYQNFNSYNTVTTPTRTTTTTTTTRVNGTANSKRDIKPFKYDPKDVGGEHE